MRKTAFILFFSLLGLSACTKIKAISQNNKPDNTQTLSDASHQPQIQDKSGMYAKLVRENGALRAKLKEENNKVSGLQSQVQNLSARLNQQKTVAQDKSRLAAEVDLDVYSRGVSETVASQTTVAMKSKGFQPKYPKLPTTMTISRATTVYYYDSSYIPAAGMLAQDLANILNHKVVTRKGASSFAKNKIIVHMRGH